MYNHTTGIYSMYIHTYYIIIPLVQYVYHTHFHPYTFITTYICVTLYTELLYIQRIGRELCWLVELKETQPQTHTRYYTYRCIMSVCCGVLSVCMQVSATYGDGFRCIGVCTVVGPKAVEKSHRVAEAILSRSALSNR